MLDIKLLRSNPEVIEASLKARNTEIDLQEILDLDQKRRDLLTVVEQKKKLRNEVSGKIGKGLLQGDEKQKAILEMREIGDRIQEIDHQVTEIEEQTRERMLYIPNLIDESTPIGADEEENVECWKWGEPTQLDFPPQHHADLGEQLGILDTERGVKIARSRFTLVRGAATRLERALMNFMLDIHTEEHGFEEVYPPLIACKESLIGSGQLPKFEEDMFKTTDGMYLISTSEVPLVNAFRDEILKESDLPKYMTAHTPCFRKEAGSYGRDTKGYIRQHQFNKVEMVKITHPEKSMEELDKLVKNAETILQRLELPYRTVQLCSGDLGFGASKCYDLEVWLPSENKYREISSCSNMKDFQARRANIKFKPNQGGKAQFVHTLNGSGLAIGRTLVAIMENYQQEDGTIKIPKALISYMGGLTSIK